MWEILFGGVLTMTDIIWVALNELPRLGCSSALESTSRSHLLEVTLVLRHTQLPSQCRDRPAVASAQHSHYKDTVNLYFLLLRMLSNALGFA